MTVAPEVADALAAGAPVVALESAVVTCGLPRSPHPAAAPHDDADWDPGAPLNLETARSMARAVRATGATPAQVWVGDGRLRVGIDDTELAELAADEAAGKASLATLGSLLVAGGRAGTTVAATLLACTTAPGGPIRVFATGGIGGVHAGWTLRPDVSGDLVALGRSPVCVVSAGAKSILDLPATLEVLEALGVPVIGFETATLPRFVARGTGSGALELASRTFGPQGPETVAAICRAHWQGLGISGGLLCVQPVAEEVALADEELAEATARAEEEAARAGVCGLQRTPFLLESIARLTGGRSLRANVALLRANATLAGRIARALVAVDNPPRR